MQWVYNFYWVAFFYFWCITLACFYLSGWKIAIVRGVRMEKGLVVNPQVAVGSQWSSRAESCSKGSKDSGGSSTTADSAPNWSCWIAPTNAAAHKKHLTCFHIWLVSGNSLVALCATNANKHPAEAQLNPVSPAYGFIMNFHQFLIFLLQTADVHHRNVLARDNPAPGVAAQGGHDPIQVIPSAQACLWQKTLTAYGMGYCWAVPNIPHLGWILENTQVSPHVHMGWT